MTHPQAFQDIAENLSYLDDWEDRYRYIIELGQALPPLAEAEKNSRYQGQWLRLAGLAGLRTCGGPPRLSRRIRRMIVRGLVAVLVALYSGRPPAEVADIDAIALFDELGLREHLTQQRSNGLVAMVTRIRGEAKALMAA